MPEITVDGAKVHYAMRPGGGPTVVFLHGGFGSSSELWAGAMAALPENCSAFAIDNFLRSDPPPEGYSVAAFSRRVAGFVAVMGLRLPVLVGHSMGGVVAQLTAIEHPGTVGGLVLVCTGPAMTNHELGRQLLARLRDSQGDIGTLREISRHWFHRLDEAFFEGYVQRAASAPLDAMIAVQASLIETDLRLRLDRVRVPTLVVFGRHDTGRTIDHAQALLAGIRGSTLAVMEESGHSPMIETPAAFNAALHAFLCSQPRTEHAASSVLLKGGAS